MQTIAVLASSRSGGQRARENDPKQWENVARSVADKIDSEILFLYNDNNNHFGIVTNKLFYAKHAEPSHRRPQFVHRIFRAQLPQFF